MKKIDQFKIELSTHGAPATDSHSKTFLLRPECMDAMRQHSQWASIEQRLIERGILLTETAKQAKKEALERERSLASESAKALAAQSESLWAQGKKAQAIIVALSRLDVASFLSIAPLQEDAASVLFRAENERIEASDVKESIKGYISSIAHELYPDVVGFETWAEFGAPDDEYFRAAISGLSDPKRCHPSFLERAMKALKSNAENNGMVWAKYQLEGGLDYADIRSAMTSHHRHSSTDYDELLRMGLSKESAREAIKEHH